MVFTANSCYIRKLNDNFFHFIISLHFGGKHNSLITTIVKYSTLSKPDIWQLYLEVEVTNVGNLKSTKLRDKYLLLGTDSEGDFCFSIKQVLFKIFFKKKKIKIWPKIRFTTSLPQSMSRASNQSAIRFFTVEWPRWIGQDIRCLINQSERSKSAIHLRA